MLGTPMASVRCLAQSIADKDSELTNSQMSTFAGLYLGMGGVCVLIGFGLAAAVPYLFKVPTAFLGETRLTLVIVTITIACGFIQQLPYGLMAAHHDFVVQNKIRGVAIITRFAVTIGFLTWAPSLLTMSLIGVLALLLDLTLSWGVVLKKYPHIRISINAFDRTKLRGIFSFSLYVMVLNIGIQLSYQTDSLVIGALIGLKQISLYSVANSLTVYFMEFVIAIGAVIMPMATKLQSEKNNAELKAMFFKWSKLSVSIALFGGIYLLVFGPRFIGWWVGSEFEISSGSVLRILMVSFLIFLPIRCVGQPILMGMGKPGLPTLAFIAAGILNLILSILLATPFGIEGIAYGTAIPNVLYAITLLVMTSRELKVSLLEYARYVFLKPILGALIPFAFLLYFYFSFQITTFFGLLLVGLAMTAVFLAVCITYTYRGDVYVDLIDAFRRLKR
jgi:O-antigen/teichoic acid export membrane protein